MENNRPLRLTSRLKPHVTPKRGDLLHGVEGAGWGCIAESPSSATAASGAEPAGHRKTLVAARERAGSLSTDAPACLAVAGSGGSFK